MGTRTLIPVLATAAACAVVLGALNVGAQNRPTTLTTPERCTPPKGSGFRATVVSNTEGRVWIKQTTRGNTVFTKFYACANGLRRHVYLATDQHQDLVDEGDTPAFSRVSVNERALDQEAVAFTKTTCPAGENPKCSYTLRWVRLKDRKILREFNTQTPERPASPIVDGAALLFWLIDTNNSTDPDCGPTPCEVRMAGIRGDRTLDSGSQIGALSVAQGTLYWTKEGNARGFDFAAEPDRMLD